MDCFIYASGSVYNRYILLTFQHHSRHVKVSCTSAAIHGDITVKKDASIEHSMMQTALMRAEDNRMKNPCIQPI